MSKKRTKPFRSPRYDELYFKSTADWEEKLQACTPLFCPPRTITEEDAITKSSEEMLAEEDLCDCPAEDYPHTRRTPSNWDPYPGEYWC